jgi:hypothetical protein
MCCLESPADDTSAAVDSPDLGTFRWQLNKKSYTDLPHAGRTTTLQNYHFSGGSTRTFDQAVICLAMYERGHLASEIDALA